VLGDRPPAYADLEQLPYLQVGGDPFYTTLLLSYGFVGAAASAGQQATCLLGT
jgi:hypothetical protein